MPLNFRPERALYDADRRMVRFLARDDSLLVHCAVTARALAAAALTQSLDSDVPLLVYRALKTRIQAVTREKYRKGLKEENGVVLIRRKDLGAL